MQELVFVGLGLNDEYGITLKGLGETQTADNIFMENYTNCMPDFNLGNFETLCGKKVQLITRRMLEEENGKIILDAAKTGKTVFLVPGDPFIATTHITLRIGAQNSGIKTRVVHGTSIMSAIVSLSGLHNYKFGKTVTVPFPDNFSTTPYNVIAQNRKLGLHTLCLLDLRAAENKYLSINQALKLLLEVENKMKEAVFTSTTVGVGIARAGSDNPIVKADFIGELKEFNFGEPPFSLIIPGELHFMEVDTLITLAGAPATFRRLVK